MKTRSDHGSAFPVPRSFWFCLEKNYSQARIAKTALSHVATLKLTQVVKISRLSKIAGAGFIGFCALSLAADTVDLNPMASQVAGFIGAFLGSLVAGRRSKRTINAHDS